MLTQSIEDTLGMTMHEAGGLTTSRDLSGRTIVRKGTCYLKKTTRGLNESDRKRRKVELIVDISCVYTALKSELVRCCKTVVHEV